MRCLALLLVAACTPPPAAVAPTSQAPTCPPPRTAPELDDAGVIARSHAFYDALDRADTAAFEAELAPGYIMYAGQRFAPREMMLSTLGARIAHHAPIHERTWSDEHVYRSGPTAVFIGKSIEHIPPDADHPAADREGYSTLVWLRGADRWQIVLQEWDRADAQAERAKWNDALASGVGFNKQPNRLLVDTVKDKKPGTALDIGMGQGRNALYLAAHGWKVTGVDIADVGLKLAQEAAAKQKLKLETVLSDIDRYDLGNDRWDLVAMIYAGNDLKLVERIKPALKKGGLFVTEYFDADSPAAKGGAGGWDDAALAAAFKDGFKILKNDRVEDEADWAGQRKTKLVRFVAQKL